MFVPSHIVLHQPSAIPLEAEPALPKIPFFSTYLTNVCSEPVLVNIRLFQFKDGSKKAFFRTVS